MIRTLFYTAAGYISGSILYGPLWAKLLRRGNITENSPDRNPGTSNAFKHGGFLCGVLTLLCDLLKAFIPVSLYIKSSESDAFGGLGLALVLAAPIIGHVFPVFSGFKGGKGIASTFGSLLGLAPVIKPALIMALIFIFYSLILDISPNYYKTAAAYLTSVPALCVFSYKADMPSVALGFMIITSAVIYKLYRSPEEREKVKVSILWMH